MWGIILRYLDSGHIKSICEETYLETLRVVILRPCESCHWRHLRVVIKGLWQESYLNTEMIHIEALCEELYCWPLRVVVFRSFEMGYAGDLWKGLIEGLSDDPIKAISEESYWETLWGAIESLREWYIEPLRVVILRTFERCQNEAFWEDHVERLWEACLAFSILDMKRR